MKILKEIKIEGSSSHFYLYLVEEKENVITKGLHHSNNFALSCLISDHNKHGEESFFSESGPKQLFAVRSPRNEGIISFLVESLGEVFQQYCNRGGSVDVLKNLLQNHVKTKADASKSWRYLGNIYDVPFSFRNFFKSSGILKCLEKEFASKSSSAVAGFATLLWHCSSRDLKKNYSYGVYPIPMYTLKYSWAGFCKKVDEVLKQSHSLDSEEQCLEFLLPFDGSYRSEIGQLSYWWGETLTEYNSSFTFVGWKRFSDLWFRGFAALSKKSVKGVKLGEIDPMKPEDAVELLKRKKFPSPDFHRWLLFLFRVPSDSKEVYNKLLETDVNNIRKVVEFFADSREKVSKNAFVEIISSIENGSDIVVRKVDKDRWRAFALKFFNFVVEDFSVNGERVPLRHLSDFSKILFVDDVNSVSARLVQYLFDNVEELKNFLNDGTRGYGNWVLDFKHILHWCFKPNFHYANTGNNWIESGHDVWVVLQILLNDGFSFFEIKKILDRVSKECGKPLNFNQWQKVLDMIRDDRETFDNTPISWIVSLTS